MGWSCHRRQTILHLRLAVKTCIDCCDPLTARVEGLMALLLLLLSTPDCCARLLVVFTYWSERVIRPKMDSNSDDPIPNLDDR
jgi:hypothetical protein